MWSYKMSISTITSEEEQISMSVGDKMSSMITWTDHRIFL